MLSTDALTALNEKYGEVFVVKGPRKDWLIALRRPKRQEWKRVRSMMHNPAQQSDANETLVRICAVFPVGQDLENMLEDWAACPEAVTSTDGYKEFIGLQAQTEEK